ncbi:MAG TPA: hypothetical protein VF065_13415 [Ilumatobacter sp.]
MTATHAARWNRVPLHVTVVAAALAGAAGVAAGSAITRDSDRPAQPAPAAVAAASPEIPIWVQAQQQSDLLRVAEAMPSGWPATEAMLDAAERPLGDSAQRARWLADAERMPTGWPATEVMRRAAGNK